MTLSLDIVKKYAPAVKFHENERIFPCSIEYLLKGSTLNYRTWRDAKKIDKQSAGTPAAIFFKDYLYIIYNSSDRSEGIWVSRSRDGATWGDTHNIGQQASGLDAAVFQDKIWIVYSDANSPQASYALSQIRPIT